MLLLSFIMLSVTINSNMLSVIMLSVVAPITQCNQCKWAKDHCRFRGIFYFKKVAIVNIEF